MENPLGVLCFISQATIGYNAYEIENAIKKGSNISSETPTTPNQKALVWYIK